MLSQVSGNVNWTQAGGSRCGEKEWISQGHKFGKGRFVRPSVTWRFVAPPLLNRRQLYCISFYCLSFALLSWAKLELIVKDAVQTQGEREHRETKQMKGAPAFEMTCLGFSVTVLGLVQTSDLFNICAFRYLSNVKDFSLWVEVVESITINWTVPRKSAIFPLPCVKTEKERDRRKETITIEVILTGSN